LKGAARAVGLSGTEALVHRLETLFVRLRSEAGAPDPSTRALIDRALDTAEDILSWARGERGEPSYDDLLPSIDRRAGTQPVPAPAPAVEPAGKPGPASQELVRITASTVDELIHASSELLAATSAAGASAARTGDYAFAVADTVMEFTRLRRSCAPHFRAHEGEATLEPVIQCLAYADSQLRTLLSQARTLAARQQRQAWDLRTTAGKLHENACGARVTPASSVFSAFGPMVRALAAELGKHVDYQTEGLECQADRLVLQALKDPVMHLLRNAVSHGVESSGVVRLQVAVTEDRLVVRIEDNGKGIDFRAVTVEAMRRGIVVPADADPAQLTRLLFLPGFSTSSAVTEVSGRGIGLSIVRQTVLRLRGDLTLVPRPGGGTVVSIWVPLSISTQHVVLFAEGRWTFALPASAVQHVGRYRFSDIRTVNGHPTVQVDAQPLELRRFADLAGLPPASQFVPGTSVQALVLQWNDARMLLAIDRLLDVTDVVVRETGLSGEDTGMSAGAIALEDGTVAVLLSMPALFERPGQPGGQSSFELLDSMEPARPATILVVDDSITTRSVEKSILEANGFLVEVAVDGAEALAKIRSRAPDLVISDVSMPVMDGFELLERLRASEDTARLPVILVTSLESREDQQRGLALGADAYIVKRKFDQKELLETVRQIL
jgi:two-component system chemotaxis sensor kinase CheA